MCRWTDVWILPYSIGDKLQSLLVEITQDTHLKVTLHTDQPTNVSTMTTMLIQRYISVSKA